MSTAGILVIGNEILSGKVQDENAPFLLRELRALGVEVLRVNTIPDVVEIIASDVKSFSAQFSYVLTSGGVGPTHDDVTMDGVAAAFGRAIVRDPRMVAMLHAAMRGREPNESHLKMTELPEGAELIETPDLWFPLVKVENVYVFPGIPRLLQAKFNGARERFVGRKIYLRKLFLACIETDVAGDLNAIVAAFPDLAIGSYPRIGEDSFRTLITLESRDEAYVAQGLDALIGRIPADYVIKVE